MISWAIPCATWTLALVAYVVLRVVEKRCEPERRAADEPGQIHQLRLTGMETGTEYRRPSAVDLGLLPGSPDPNRIELPSPTRRRPQATRRRARLPPRAPYSARR